MTTIFEEEIRSQGDILVDARNSACNRRATPLARGETWTTHSSRLVVLRTTPGRSSNTSPVVNSVSCRTATPSLFQDERTMKVDGAGVLAVSQSGKSPGMIEVVRTARAQGRPNVVVTNDAHSPLALEGDSVVELFTGPERAIASTKTFTSSCHALAQFVSALSGSSLDGLDAVPDIIERTVEWALTNALRLRY